MAKIRLNPLSSKERDFPHREGETLQQIYDRFWGMLPSQKEGLENNYIILLNGKIIDRALWKDIASYKNDDVLIAVTLAGGSNRGIFKQVLIIAAVVAVTIATKNMTSGSALYVAYWAPAVTGIATGLALNSLLPPVVAGLGGIDFGLSAYEDSKSQSYNISGQSNTISRYGIVPKVYGRHRIFPKIAAPPYIDIEVDPDSNTQVQMFHCIYDFGLGPGYVSDMKIGDTSFSEYDDANFRIVDLKKGSISEGVWDDQSSDHLEFYKGTYKQEQVNAVINKNLTDSGASPSEYQATRNADDSGNGEDQQINLILAFPQGLTTYGTNGERSTRTVEIDVEYAEVGTENWYNFNQQAFQLYCNAGLVSGSGEVVLLNANLTVIDSWTMNCAQAYGAIGRDECGWVRKLEGLTTSNNSFTSSTALSVGSIIYNGDTYIGKVINVSGSGGNYIYTLNNYFPYSIVVRENYYYNGTFDSGFSKNLASFRYNSEPSTISFSANKTTSVYLSVKFMPYTTNQIKVRVTRRRSYGGYDYKTIDGMVWYTLTTRFLTSPIVTDKRHLFCEVKIKATDQLNGTLQNLSGVVQSAVNVWDGSTWTREISNNPAWIFADILTGEINKNAINLSRLDTASLLEWANYCDEYPTKYGGGTFDTKRFEANFVLDYKVTLTSLLNKVSNAAGAGLNLIDGNYGVLIDKKRNTPVQVFTPRNSSNFSSSRSYTDIPHGLKIKYVDASSDWGVKEVIVYSDGYNASTATVFEDFSTFACTNDQQAWRYGRYMLAQVKLRQETISIDVDFEHLVCTRGDYVLFQQDVMKVGGTPARVKSVLGTVITIDDSFSGTVGGTYGYTFRGVSGIITSTMTLDSSTTATVNGAVPSVGDLIIWGDIGSVTFNAIVKTITPNGDLTATITLIERANAIHDAESGMPIPDYSPQIATTTNNAPGEVQNLTSSNDISCKNGGYLYTIELSWDAPIDNVVDIYEIYVDYGEGYILAGYSSLLRYSYEVNKTYLDTEHSVKVLGVSSQGEKLSLGDVTATTITPLNKTESPSDVDALYINVLDQTLQLNWEEIPDCDTSYYLIRYSPSLTSSWFSSIPLQTVKAGTSMTTVQARVGSYFIKAIDWNGNESDNEALAKTSIPNLVDLNVIEETNDFPDLEGNKDRVEKSSGQLFLQVKTSGGGGGVTEYYSEGYYYYKDLLDLGEIYTVRVQSLIEAEGFNDDDLMSSWTKLSDVTFLQTSTVSDWDVISELRSTDEFITMDTWTHLSDVTTLDSGSADVWTAWRAFTIGDFTGKIFQFRLKLVSNKASVSPRVFDGVIKSDMPDRVISFDNVTIPTSGYDFNYSPEFKGPGTTPMIQITQDNASQGDYYLITNKTLNGCTVKMYDKNDTLVERQIDFLAKGYGRKYTSVL